MNIKDLIAARLSSIDATKIAEAAKADNEEKEYINSHYISAIGALDIQMKAAEIKRYKKEHKVRIKLIGDLFAFSAVWLTLVFILLFGKALNNLYISDNVLITLLTTSTAEVLGFFYIVLKYMFNENKST